jgi:predicted RNase H-like HicB family nuclease
MKELMRRVKEALEFWVEERESVRAYDTAKAYGGETIPFEQAVTEIERVRCDTCSECPSSNEVKI